MIHADPGTFYRGIAGLENINDGGRDAPLTSRDARFIVRFLLTVLALGIFVGVVLSVAR